MPEIPGFTITTSEHVPPGEAYLLGWFTNEDGERELDAIKITGLLEADE